MVRYWSHEAHARRIMKNMLTTYSRRTSLYSPQPRR